MTANFIIKMVCTMAAAHRTKHTNGEWHSISQAVCTAATATNAACITRSVGQTLVFFLLLSSHACTIDGSQKQSAHAERKNKNEKKKKKMAIKKVGAWTLHIPFLPECRLFVWFGFLLLRCVGQIAHILANDYWRDDDGDDAYYYAWLAHNCWSCARPPVVNRSGDQRCDRRDIIPMNVWTEPTD